MNNEPDQLHGPNALDDLAVAPRAAQRARLMITREHAFRAAQNAVRNQGYAVALHGSQIRDLDLLAVPWRRTAIDAKGCAEMIAKAIPGVLLEPVEEKPYGRLAWEIHPLRSAGHQWGHGFDQWYVDLSVMPRTPCDGEHEELREAAQAVVDEWKRGNFFSTHPPMKRLRELVYPQDGED